MRTWRRPKRQPASASARCSACWPAPRPAATRGAALPAAAGLELLHNFSLIHDDIEDNSPTRRHRPTAWALFGMPMACNAGDAMFSLAHLAFFRLPERACQRSAALAALRRFDETCVALTEGQFLDMSFESAA